jgi:hypothetical protein
LHPCVPGRLQSLHFFRRRLGTALGGFAIDEQKLRHDGAPDGFVSTGEGLSPASCEYNEQAATIRTPAQDKNFDAPDTIGATGWTGRSLDDRNWRSADIRFRDGQRFSLSRNFVLKLNGGAFLGV